MKKSFMIRISLGLGTSIVSIGGIATVPVSDGQNNCLLGAKAVYAIVNNGFVTGLKVLNKEKEPVFYTLKQPLKRELNGIYS